MTQPTFDPDTCERIVHAALAAGDIEGVRAALTVMAPQDPHRAQMLLDTLRVGVTLAEGYARCPGRVVAYADGRTGRCMKGPAGHEGECA